MHTHMTWKHRRRIYPFLYSNTQNGDAGVRACGRAGVRACGRAGVRACGRAGVRACGRAGVRACGRAGIHIECVCIIVYI